MRVVSDATAKRAACARAHLGGQKRGIVCSAGSDVEDAVPESMVLAWAAASEQCVGGLRFCAGSTPIELTACLGAEATRVVQRTSRGEAGAGLGALACWPVYHVAAASVESARCRRKRMRT
jgi:hypothetical protein